jgi:hypothetical protein
MAGPGTEITAAEAIPGRLRASHGDREQVIGTLKAAFVQGRLTKDELDARAGQALAARTYADLAALTADLPAGLAASHPHEAARPRAAKDIRTYARVTIIAATVVAAILLVRPEEGWAGATAWFGLMLAGATMVGASAGTVVLMVESRRRKGPGGQLPSANHPRSVARPLG